jgi:hypothetical protein
LPPSKPPFYLSVVVETDGDATLYRAKKNRQKLHVIAENFRTDMRKEWYPFSLQDSRAQASHALLAQGDRNAMELVERAENLRRKSPLLATDKALCVEMNVDPAQLSRARARLNSEDCKKRNVLPQKR